MNPVATSVICFSTALCVDLAINPMAEAKTTTILEKSRAVT